MKCFIALFLSLILGLGSLFPKTDVEEVFKLPELIEHYYEHKAGKDSNLNFIDFLLLHYGPEGKTHRSEQSHAKLPMFQHQVGGFVFILPAVMPVIYSVHVAQQLVVTHLSLYRNIYSFFYRKALLQPPKA